MLVLMSLVLCLSHKCEPGLRVFLETEWYHLEKSDQKELDKLVYKAIDIVFATVRISKHKVFYAFVDNSVYS